MNPDQPNYDFILNPNQPKKSGGFGGSMKGRFIVIAGLAVVVIIAISVITTLISNANRGPVEKLKEVAAQQAEIIRVADLGQKNSKSSDGKGFASSVRYSVMTDQAKLAPLLETAGIKLSPLELESKKNSQSDEALSAAALNNRYDEALKEILTSYLNDYKVMLKAAYDGGAGPNTKLVLEAAYNSADAITGTGQ